MAGIAKIAVAGNATIDAIILGEARIIGEDAVQVVSDGKSEVFQIEDPPVRPGFKHRVNQNIAQKVAALWHRMQPGGGGYNSIIAMQNLPGIDAELALTYIDVSIPHHLIQRGLDAHNIAAQFFLERDVPYNAIVEIGGDRSIFKGPSLGRVAPDEEQARRIERIICGNDALLITGVKDVGYYETYIKNAAQRNIPIYAVVSTSADKDFVFTHVLPNVRCIFSWDEVPFLYGINKQLDEKEKTELAFDAISMIRHKIMSNIPVYITLGKNGALCASKSAVRHVFLQPEYAEKINEVVSSRRTKVNGAGDVFAGALVAYDTAGSQKVPLNTLIILSSTAAIRHIGYNGSLPQDAFKVIEYPIKPSTPF